MLRSGRSARRGMQLIPVYAFGFLRFAHRAVAALRADSVRAFFESFAARAFPPMRANSLIVTTGMVHDGSKCVQVGIDKQASKHVR